MKTLIDISVTNKNFIANSLIVHNSAQRFARLREGAVKQHFKKIAEHMKNQFLGMHDLKGIIIGGPGTTVNSFLGKEYLTGDVKKKIIGHKDLSYTGEFGLQELLDKSQDLLAKEEVAIEKKVMQRFFKLLSTEEKKVGYGKADVEKKLQMGAVEVLLLSTALDDDMLDHFQELADAQGTEVNLISIETREGVQLRDMGKIAAILRYPVDY